MFSNLDLVSKTRKSVGKGDPRNPRTSIPTNNNDSMVAVTDLIKAFSQIALSRELIKYRVRKQPKRSWHAVSLVTYWNKAWSPSLHISYVAVDSHLMPFRIWVFHCLFGVYRRIREFFAHKETSPLPMKGFCSALMVIEQWGFFSVPHLLWHEGIRL